VEEKKKYFKRQKPRREVSAQKFSFRSKVISQVDTERKRPLSKGGVREKGEKEGFHQRKRT